MTLAITTPVVEEYTQLKQLCNVVEHYCYMKITNSSCHGHWLWMMLLKGKPL